MASALPRRTPQARRPAKSSLVIRNVVVGGHRTSVRLEPAMWEALADIARHRQQTLRDLVTQIERDRTASSLTAAIRVYIVEFYRSVAVQAGLVSAESPRDPPRRMPV
jgi:predicted DNA-binding ribbon-helix-helix protein